MYLLLLLAICILLAVIFRQYEMWRKSRALLHIPTHDFLDGHSRRARCLSELKDLLESGYRRYSKSGRAFKIPIPVGGYSVEYRVVLPKDHLEETKLLPNNIFSWELASVIIFAQDHTSAPKRGAWSGKAIHVGIHQNLRDITRQLDRKIGLYFNAHLPREPGTSSAIKPMGFFIPAIASMINAMLVGEQLAGDPEWIAQTCDFAVNHYKSADDVRCWPPYLAALVASWIPSVRRIRKSRTYVKAKLNAVYEDLKRRTTGDGKFKFRKSNYGYEWLWGGAPDDVALDDFSDTMMRTLIALIHTTAKTISIALVDLLSQPEYLNELRHEVREATLPGWNHRRE